MELTVVVELVNIILLAFLLIVYANNYRQMRSALGLGLVVFAAFLLAQNLIAVYFHFSMIDYYSNEVMQHAFILSSVQTVALAALAWVTWKE
ncbi:MAG TPA: hypothetical protein VJG83_01965 [archaeon]|nr:hypothetical protein [archaeon]